MGDFYSTCCMLCRTSPFISSNKGCALLMCYIQSFLSHCNFIHPKCLGSFCNYSVIQPVLQMDKGSKPRCLGLLFKSINPCLLIEWLSFKFSSTLTYPSSSFYYSHQHCKAASAPIPVRWGCDRGAKLDSCRKRRNI